MDPTQALSDLLDALNERDIDTVVERAEALHGWISKGGALPTQTVGHGLTKDGWLVFLTGILGYWGDPDNIRSRKKFASEMKKIAARGEPEGDHIRGDRLMMETLSSLGYHEGVETFDDMDKWYS